MAFSCLCRPVPGCMSRCRRQSLGHEAENAVDDTVVALHEVADLVVFADAAEDYHRAEVRGMGRQWDLDTDVLEPHASEEVDHLVGRGNDAVRADHLDRTRRLKPRHASWAVINEDLVAFEDSSGGFSWILCGRQSRSGVSSGVSEVTNLVLDDCPWLSLPVDDRGAAQHHLASAVSAECALDLVEELQVRESG